jgi:ABC-type multidrug transport system fused ATPase/permease subunit
VSDPPSPYLEISSVISEPNTIFKTYSRRYRCIIWSGIFFVLCNVLSFIGVIYAFGEIIIISV